MRSRSSPTAKGASESDHAPCALVVAEPWATLVAPAVAGVVAFGFAGVLAPAGLVAPVLAPRSARYTATATRTPGVGEPMLPLSAPLYCVRSIWGSGSGDEAGGGGSLQPH